MYPFNVMWDIVIMIAAHIHRDERKGDAPSDHVPVSVELTDDGSEDVDRPMIF